MDPLQLLHYHITDYFASNLALEATYFEGAAAYKLGVGTPGFNWVYVQDGAWNYQEIMPQIEDFFAQNAQGFSIIMPIETVSSGMTNFLSAHQYTAVSGTVTMACDLSKGAITLKKLEGMEQILSTNSDLGQWIKPLNSAFEGSDEVGALYAQRHEYALSNGADLQHYTLFVEGVPITSLTLTINEGVGRIDDVGTMVEYQGRGFATKLLQYALSAAQQQGVDYCFLEASMSGRSVYERLGFFPIDENSIFESPENISLQSENAG